MNVKGITSPNFEFLKEHDALLVQFAMQAERYCFTDPNTCLIKLRQFAELNRPILSENKKPKAQPTEQKRIVAKIEALQARSRAAKGHLDQVPALLDKLRQSVLAAAFRGDLTKEWRAKNPNVEPASVLLERIKKERRPKWEAQQLDTFKSKGKKPPKNWQTKYKEPAPVDTDGLPALPEGWCWASADCLCVEPVRTGKSVKGSDRPPGIPNLRLNALQTDIVNFDHVRYVPLDKPSVASLGVEEGDFFVSRGNGSLSLLGKGALAGRPPGFTIFPDTAFRFRFDSHVRAWATSIWAAEFVRNYIQRKAKTTAGIYKISQTDIIACPVPLPPELEMYELVCRIGAVHSREEVFSVAEKCAREKITLFDESMLQKAFRGELVAEETS